MKDPNPYQYDIIEDIKFQRSKKSSITCIQNTSQVHTLLKLNTNQDLRKIGEFAETASNNPNTFQYISFFIYEDTSNPVDPYKLFKLYISKIDLEENALENINSVKCLSIQ